MIPACSRFSSPGANQASEALPTTSTTTSLTASTTSTTAHAQSPLQQFAGIPSQRKLVRWTKVRGRKGAARSRSTSRSSSRFPRKRGTAPYQEHLEPREGTVVEDASAIDSEPDTAVDRTQEVVEEDHVASIEEEETRRPIKAEHTWTHRVVQPGAKAPESIDLSTPKGKGKQPVRAETVPDDSGSSRPPSPDDAGDGGGFGAGPSFGRLKCAANKIRICRNQGVLDRQGLAVARVIAWIPRDPKGTVGHQSCSNCE